MDREEAARQIIDAVSELFFSAENQATFHGAADDLGLQPPALKALLGFEPGEGVPMRQLAEMWACDASFVTVVSDALEAAGYAARRVAAHDRRIKTVELTEAGVEARERALAQVYGRRAGFDALTTAEMTMLATLLGKVVAAQTDYDESLRDQPEVRSTVRRVAAQRTREHRERLRGPAAGGWKEHFEAHRREITSLKEELARVRAEIKAQAKAAKAEAKAQARRPLDAAKAEAKAAKAEAKARGKAEAMAVRDDLVDKLKGGRGYR